MVVVAAAADWGWWKRSIAAAGDGRENERLKEGLIKGIKERKGAGERVGFRAFILKDFGKNDIYRWSVFLVFSY